ncbi:T9SS type A sorting domain-containing protein [Hymenobacter psoromatis]|uniref:T9SS type A sorting domain-containing protein n=1 Tax=Hymenobacter psoromatis TaxID=1484116 RepID=UPI001CBE926E|nr:T9SS type A sorting domain-containing protein [Hymenobacter psoromatis]
MKKLSTLALATTLVGAALNAQAQITLDGVISATEIGAGNYVSLGKFTTPHDPGKGFGNAGLLQMYGANANGKLYVGIAGTIASGNNNFQLYMDLPNKSGVPVGTGLPTIAGSGTVFGTFAGGSIGGTKLDLEADAAIATTGQFDVQAAIYTATTGQAKSLGGGAAITSDGVPNPLYDATGAYAIFANTRVAYKQSPDGGLLGMTGNPGAANGGGAGSTGLEYEFDGKALGLPSGASIVRVFVAYVSGDAYWSSDFIPESVGNGKAYNTPGATGGNNNLGYSPDFTDATNFPGTQAAAINLVVLSSRQADDAVVAMSVFPNPTQGQATITYQVQNTTQPVAVRVIDLLGRDVRTLLDTKQTPGFHDLTVPTSELALGTYLIKVQVGDKVATRRLAVSR